MRVESEVLHVNGHEILLRNAKKEDAKMLIDFLKVVCSETRFLLREPEEIKFTLEQEEAFIENINKSESNLFLMAFCDGEFVGNCSIMTSQMYRYRHRCNLAISLFQRYTGMGIGKVMLNKLIDIAKEKGYEQIELEVVSNNERAIGLYKKLGFEIYGTFPNNMKYKDGTYADVYWMMKKI